MWIPPTIPEFILRVFTRKQTNEELEAQRESGIIQSGDAGWDDKFPSVKFTLVSCCTKKIAASYADLTQKVDEANKNYRKQYDTTRATWKQLWKQYKIDRAEYDRQMEEHEEQNMRLSLESADDYFDTYAMLGLSTTDLELWEEPDEPIVPPPAPPPLRRATAILSYLSATDRLRVIEALHHDKIVVPMDLALRTIPDPLYWKVLAEKKFPEAAVDEHGNSWRRVFIERSLRQLIEYFHPYEGNWDEFQKELDTFGRFAQGLELSQLIPICYGVPRKVTVPANFVADKESAGKEEDEGYTRGGVTPLPKSKVKGKKKESPKEITPPTTPTSEDSERPDRNDNSHVALNKVLPKMKNLRYLSIMYKMQAIGLEYEPRFEDFTVTDCKKLSRGVKKCLQLRKFELQRSHVTDEKTKILCRRGLRFLHHLKILNLSYNPLGNAGALAIARLITDDRSSVFRTLHTLILCSCEIKREGAKALAYALTKNKQLRKLKLSLNPLHDSGGKAIANGVVENENLLFLDLAATNLGPKACTQLGKMLLHNTTLRELNLSSNPAITSHAAWDIAKAVEVNQKIYKVDFRACGIDEGLELTMGQKCHNHVMAKYQFPTDAKKFSKKENMWAKVFRFHHLTTAERQKLLADSLLASAEKEGTEGEEEEEGAEEGQGSPSVKAPEPIQPQAATIDPALISDKTSENKEQRRVRKPFALEERRLRYLMKFHNVDEDYEPWLRGERLDNYIEFLEEKTKVNDKKFKRRHKRHRWVRPNNLEKVPSAYLLLQLR